MMKKILFLGAVAKHDDLVVGGEVAKSRITYKYLKNKYNIKVVDTYWKRKNLLQKMYHHYIKKIINILKIVVFCPWADEILLVNCHGNYVKLINKLGAVQKLKIIGIGNLVAEHAISTGIEPEIWSETAGIFVESDEMISDLKNVGINSGKILLNYKELPYYTAVTAVGKKEKLSIFYIGRICEEKGIDCVLDALDKINHEKIIVVFHLYGIFENGYEEKSKIKERKDVVYHGTINLIDGISEYDKLRQHDIFVFPSKWKAESISSAMIDAVALGKPILATDFNLNALFIDKDNVNGFLFPVDDSDKLREYIEFFYYNQDSIAEYGKASFKVADKFRVENAIMALDL